MTDACGRKIQVGDSIVFYQPMSKVNGRTGVRSSNLYANSAMGPKAKSLQQGVVLGISPKPTKTNPYRIVVRVRYGYSELSLDRLDRIAVVGRV